MLVVITSMITSRHGIPRISYDFLTISYDFPMISYDFPMISWVVSVPGARAGLHREQRAHRDGRCYREDSMASPPPTLTRRCSGTLVVG